MNLAKFTTKALKIILPASLYKKTRYGFHYWRYKIPALMLASPVFVVGCGHSGTSIMLRLLGQHSRIHPIPGETYVFLPRNKEFDPCDSFDRMVAFNRQTFEVHKHRWAEKTPMHIWSIARILTYLPKAKVIIMIRDGRDVACSRRIKVGDFAAGIERWIRENEIALPFHQHPQVKVVKYEDVVRFPEQTIKEVLSFLNERYEFLLDYHKTEVQWYSNKNYDPRKAPGQQHPAYRNWQVNQPLFTSSLERWKTEMTEEEKMLFYSKASEMLSRLGYN